MVLVRSGHLQRLSLPLPLGRVTLKPWAGLTVDAVIDVWVGAFYGPGVTYRYRAVR